MRAGPEVELLTLCSAPAAYPQFRWQHPSCFDPCAANGSIHRLQRRISSIENPNVNDYFSRKLLLWNLSVNGLLRNGLLEVNSGRTVRAGARLRSCKPKSDP